ARLERRALLAVLSGLDAARRDRARSGRGEKYLPLLTLAVLESEPHTVTEGPRVERVGPGGIEQRVLVAHLEQHVQHALVDAGEDAEAVAIVPGEVRPRGRIVWPVVGVAIEKRRSRQRQGLEVVRTALQERVAGGLIGGRFGSIRRRGCFTIQKIRAPLERGGDGLGDRLERVLLPLAQRGLHLARVLASAPGQYQCRASACTIQNSVSDSSTTRPSHCACMRSASSVSAPRRTISPGVSGLRSASTRRNSAFTRAIRCARLRSLVRKSSAPRRSPDTASSSLSRAVRNMIGNSADSARSCRHSSKPPSGSSSREMSMTARSGRRAANALMACARLA